VRAALVPAVELGCTRLVGNAVGPRLPVGTARPEEVAPARLDAGVLVRSVAGALAAVDEPAVAAALLAAGAGSWVGAALEGAAVAGGDGGAVSARADPASPSAPAATAAPQAPRTAAWARGRRAGTAPR